MNLIRRSISLDPATNARLRELAAERGQDEAAVLTEAVALLDSVVDIGTPDIAEDRRRLKVFKRTRGSAFRRKPRSTSSGFSPHFASLYAGYKQRPLTPPSTSSPSLNPH